MVTDSEDLQILLDTYETQGMTWDMRADEVGAHAARNGWEDHLLVAVKDFWHKAETCRDLAQEVLDAMPDNRV